MTNYHYLKTELEEPSVSLEALSDRFSTATGDPSLLSACARELSRLPHSADAEKLASNVREGLHDRMMIQALPQSYPLPPDAESPWRELESGWHALAKAHVRWMESAGAAGMGHVVDALYCLRQIVLVRGIAHWSVPDGLWRDVHGIYHSCLEAEGVHKRMRRSFLRHHSRTTIEWEYLQLLLLGMTDPWSQIPQELMALDSMVEKWMPMLGLETDGNEGWYIDETSDSPVEWGQGGEGRRLNLDGLLEFFDSHGELASPVGRFEWVEHPDDTLSGALLAHWCQIWGHALRPGDGIPGIEEAELEVGLCAIFDRWRDQVTSGARIVAAAAEEWRVMGQSVQIGDLVAVFDPGATQIGHLAVICRVGSKGPGDSVVGVQFRILEGEVTPVAVQPLNRSARPLACQRGLLLHDQGKSTLIVAWQPFREGMVVRLLSGGKIYPVSLLTRENLGRGIMACACESAAGRFQK